MDKREYMFMESFFRGQSILDGLSLAANDLGETTSDMRVYLMSLPSNPVTVQGQYLAGCRYKAMHDVGMSYAKIAQKVARHEERVRRYIKVVENFKPCEIYPDLKITHYINATFEKDPKKYILEQRYIRKGAFSLAK